MNIENFLKKYFSSRDKIILACSTGPDSMYLLYKILETNYKKNLVVCYFDHKLRKESEKEVKFIKDMGKKYDFIVEIQEENIKKIQKESPSIGIEEIAREKRYEFFKKTREIYGAKYILTAHHLDDKIETFFFNLIRGTKLTGLINMKENNGSVLRPLLEITKTEIISWLEEKNLPYNIDSSNFDIAYTRNYLRHDIIPLFSKINKSYKKNIKNTLCYFEEIKDFIDEEVKKFIADEDSFYIDEFFEKPILLQKEIIRYCFYLRNNNSTIGLSEGNIDEIIKFIGGKNDNTKKKIKNLSMKKNKTKIMF
ncbi:tRNA lysidine(34) synthetase TilS [Candidatus Gracilibacteria bacterium]|nr:tRNA lysidine(34) synthetase TilS [Candidatus Gracilibacteria bacterium]NUJ99269.1 tRNA lysidine(34) synthetase TilS [Candidatus Gracilibacteria bacterium]